MKIQKNDLVFLEKNINYYSYRENELRQAKKTNKEILIKNYTHREQPNKNEVYRYICDIEIEKDAYVVIVSEKKKIYIVRIDSIRQLPKKNEKIKFKHPQYGEMIGTVIALPEIGGQFSLSSNMIGVVTNEKKELLHNLNGKCLDGYGWYTSLEDIIGQVEEEQSVLVIKDDIEVPTQIKDLTEEIKKLTKEISRKERMQDLLNEAIIEKGKEIAVEDLKNKLKEDLDKFIEEKYGILPKKIDITNGIVKKELTGIFHKEFENICKIVNANIPLMLVGSAGAGKNHTLEQVAEALCLEFYFSNAVNQEYKLTGFIDANGKYHETEFYKAFTKGGMFFLDEIDASCPECLVILNSAIANRYFDFPTGRVKAHENFRVVCAGNTYGTGADMVYVGRNVLDGATLDRFVVVQFDYDEQVERQLAYDEDLYLFIKNLRNAINEAHLRYIVSMRALINATKLLELGTDKMSILKTTIIKNMQIDDLNTIVNKINYSSEWTNELKRMCDNVGA